MPKPRTCQSTPRYVLTSLVLNESILAVYFVGILFSFYTGYNPGCFPEPGASIRLNNIVTLSRAEDVIASFKIFSVIFTLPFFFCRQMTEYLLVYLDVCNNRRRPEQTSHNCLHANYTHVATY